VESGGPGEHRTGVWAVLGSPVRFWIGLPSYMLLRSGVGVILTSPSLLVEGVRSGSQRRNAATAPPLAGGVPNRDRGAQRPYGRALRCAVLPVCGGMPAHLRMARRGPTRRKGDIATRYTACLLLAFRSMPYVSSRWRSRAAPRAHPPPGSALWTPRPARARHHRAGPADQLGSSVMLSDAAEVIFLAAQLSSSRSARLGWAAGIASR